MMNEEHTQWRRIIHEWRMARIRAGDKVILAEEMRRANLQAALWSQP